MNGSISCIIHIHYKPFNSGTNDATIATPKKLSLASITKIAVIAKRRTLKANNMFVEILLSVPTVNLSIAHKILLHYVGPSIYKFKNSTSYISTNTDKYM